MTLASMHTVACAHCGAPAPPPAHGAVVRCGHCRGWTLLGTAGSAAIRAVRAAARIDETAAVDVLSRHTQKSGFGAPRILEARTEWVTYFAREGALRAVIRYGGRCDEKSWSGFVGVPVGPDPQLPLEVLDPTSVQAVDDAGVAILELSLDGLDELVRAKLDELVRGELRTRGIVAWDIDLHPRWGPEVKLIYVPVVSVRFALDPPGAARERANASPMGSYLARVGGHDGALKSVELPTVERNAELVGVGVAFALLAGLFVVLSLATAAVLVLAP